VCVAGEIHRICDVREEHEELQCITNHPGFQTVCLDPYVLQVHITNIANSMRKGQNKEMRKSKGIDK
jgi:hypothetical protein